MILYLDSAELISHGTGCAMLLLGVSIEDERCITWNAPILTADDTRRHGTTNYLTYSWQRGGERFTLIYQRVIVVSGTEAIAEVNRGGSRFLLTVDPVNLLKAGE